MIKIDKMKKKLFLVFCVYCAFGSFQLLLSGEPDENEEKKTAVYKKDLKDEVLVDTIKKSLLVRKLKKWPYSFSLKGIKKDDDDLQSFKSLPNPSLEKVNYASDDIKKLLNDFDFLNQLIKSKISYLSKNDKKAIDDTMLQSAGGCYAYLNNMEHKPNPSNEVEKLPMLVFVTKDKNIYSVDEEEKKITVRRIDQNEGENVFSKLSFDGRKVFLSAKQCDYIERRGGHKFKIEIPHEEKNIFNVYSNLFVSDEGKVMNTLDLIDLHDNYFEYEERNIPLSNFIEYKQRLKSLRSDIDDYKDISFEMDYVHEYFCSMFELMVKNVDLYEKIKAKPVEGNKLKEEYELDEKGFRKYTKNDIIMSYTTDFMPHVKDVIEFYKNTHNGTIPDFRQCSFYKQDPRSSLKIMHNKVVWYPFFKAENPNKDSKKNETIQVKMYSTVARDLIEERNMKMRAFFTDWNPDLLKFIEDEILNKDKKDADKNKKEESKDTTKSELDRELEAINNVGMNKLDEKNILFMQKHYFDFVSRGYNLFQLTDYKLLNIDIEKTEAKTNQNILHKIAKGNNTTMYEELLKSKSEYVDKHINDQDALGDTPLHVSITSGNSRMFDLLIKNTKINIDIQNLYGYTPLHLAVLNKNIGQVKILLSKGASLEKKSKGEKNALQLAILMGYYDMAHYLSLANKNKDDQTSSLVSWFSDRFQDLFK